MIYIDYKLQTVVVDGDETLEEIKEYLTENWDENLGGPMPACFGVEAGDEETLDRVHEMRQVGEIPPGSLH